MGKNEELSCCRLDGAVPVSHGLVLYADGFAAHECLRV